MGVPLVGKRHHRKANTSQGAVGMFGTISKRISGMCGSRRSSDAGADLWRYRSPLCEDSALQRDASWLIHGIHHDYPWDRDRLVMPPTVTALIAGGVWFGFRWLGAAEHAWMAGMVGGWSILGLLRRSFNRVTTWDQQRAYR